MDNEMPVDMFLCGGVPSSTPRGMTIWKAATLSSRTVLHQLLNCIFPFTNHNLFHLLFMYTNLAAEWQLFEQNNMRIHTVHRENRFSKYVAWYEQRTRLHLKPASKEKWTLAYDTGGWRWGFMTSNMAEMFNSLLRGCRSLPVTAIASFTFYKLNAWFVSRKKATCHYGGQTGLGQT
jgi:hypothetical protein